MPDSSGKPPAPSTTDKPRVLRPKDAATLIVLRRQAGQCRVLMGQRSEQHRFMPGKFVFPGGRVDRADSRIEPQTSLAPVVEEKLLNRMHGRPSTLRARALAMAAVRETFEETGLAIGESVDHTPRTRSADWRAFFETGVAPSLEHMHFVARAITPPHRVRRFDTRFFAVDADHIQGDPHVLSSASNELLHLHWLTFDDARKLDLPRITSIVLDELERRFAGGRTSDADPTLPVPFYYQVRGRFRREEL